ncbi:MAG: xanthine dehydrogenase family protein molybdopterin-binding subunit [Gemmatimonadaceae bacterium]
MPNRASEPGSEPTGGRFVVTNVEVEGRDEIVVVEMPAFEPKPWSEDAVLGIVGAPVPRADAHNKVTGRARYTVDIKRAGMLHAAILRAPIARGRLTALDLTPALSSTGVRDVISCADLPDIKIAGLPLFDRVIRYAGQPIAAVCADSNEAAHSALRAVRAEYEAAPHAVTAEDAMAEGAPMVRGKSNRMDESPAVVERGDVEAALRESEIVIHRTYRTPVALHTSLEPHASVAEWDGEVLTIWESTQGIFRIRSDIAKAFGLPLNRVRVLMDYMGGGFGSKNSARAHVYVAAAFARRLSTAVRAVNDREAEQMDTGNRPATIQRVTLAARGDGQLTAIVLDAVVPLGIGGWDGGPSNIYHEMYACANVRTTETFVYINASAMSAFRAPGHVEGAFGLECAMDSLARKVGIDPLELRLRNYAKRDGRKDRPYTGKRLDECYRIGAERFGWAARGNGDARGEMVRVGRAAAANFVFGGGPLGASNSESLRRGFGMASQCWGTGGGPPAYATVRVNNDGSADVLTGSQDLGTGARTIFAQIAAEALGARLQDVRVTLGDTDRTPYTGNSWGSMTTPSVGPAVRMAAEDARAQLLEAAASVLKTTPDKLEARGSVIRVKRGRRSITFKALGEELGDVMIIGHGSRGPNPDGEAIHTFGAHFAEVEVDVDTGIVRVARIVAVHDAGRIINPALAESQLQGGIIQGIGYALFEERIMDSRLGVPMNPNMHDYKIPTLSDIPSIDASLLAGADIRANHIGARGLAEPPIIPVAPAIANAVADAIGAEVTEIPLTPWRVLKSREVGSGRREGGEK